MIGFIGLFDTVRDYTLQYTVTHTHKRPQSLQCRYLVAASKGGRSLSSGFPNCPLPQQQVTTTEPQQSSLSLTHS
jgi:hypothetical protein